jgi:hydrogenase nickel incorporation protein HypB
MCGTCGCSDSGKPEITDLQTGKTVNSESTDTSSHGHSHSHSHMHTHDSGHSHSHDHEHLHEHSHAHSHDGQAGHPHDHWHKHDHSHEIPMINSVASAAVSSTTISLEEKILAKNDLLAERNRGWFAGANVLALNLVSSPGAGKTTLLELTIKTLMKELPVAVVEGDQATLRDAERIKKTGSAVVQINTGAGCHLDAQMVAAAIEQLKPSRGAVVFIENVGNLVCPALFDLGEKSKVVVLSVTEGEDKPLKYPHMFRAAQVLLINKIDLLPHLDFDIDACKKMATDVNPALTIFELSAKTGAGIDDWLSWIRAQIRRPTE